MTEIKNVFNESCSSNSAFLKARKESLPVSRARDVSPTPADLGGVTSILYELEHRYKYSFLAIAETKINGTFGIL